MYKMQTSLLAAAFLASLTVATPVSAAQATLIADVNFSNIVTTTKSGVLNVSFSIMSSFGSQSSVTYGVVVRGKKSGALLDSMTAGSIDLPEGKTITKTLEYPLPTYLTEDATVYLASYNPQGISLALQEVGNVAKGVSKATCTQNKGEVTCTSQQKGSLAVNVQKDTPQGKVIATSVNSIASATPVTTRLATLIEELPAGKYSVSFIVKNEGGTVLSSFVAEYIREGEYAHILSIAPKVSPKEGTLKLEVTVFAAAQGLATSTELTLVAHAGSCGDSSPSALSGEAVTVTISISKACTDREVTVDLLKGTTIIDSMKGIFVVPESLSSISRPGSMTLYTLIGAILFLLVVGVGVWRTKSKKDVSTTTLGLLLIGAAFFGGATKVSAATYLIGGTPEYIPCIVGSWTNGYQNSPFPGCEDSGAPTSAYTTSGTITVPSSVTYGQTYNINITHSISDFFNTNCMDTFPTWYTCGSTNIGTRVYHGLPSVPDSAGERYNTLNPGAPGRVHPDDTGATFIGEVGYPNASGIVSVTAASSGSSETVQFLQAARAGFSIECVTWKKRCITYEYSYDSVSIPFATPTVNIHF